jgi:hypothetical protein
MDLLRGGVIRTGRYRGSWGGPFSSGGDFQYVHPTRAASTVPANRAIIAASIAIKIPAGI